MLFLALNGSDRLGRQVAHIGGFEIARHEQREFDGAEHKAQTLVDVRGQGVLVLHSLNGDPYASANDKTLRQLFFLAAFSRTTLVDTITLTDSVAARKATQDSPGDRLRLVTCAPLIADAITRLHHPLDGGQ